MCPYWYIITFDSTAMQLLNGEGLPIVEITEPIQRVPESAPGASSGTAQIEDAEDARFVPMYRLPPAERVRNRAQMDRILDMLEEEERVKEERTLVHDREERQDELERHQANAKAELERVKAAKEMQKKMGKALLMNMADAREKEKQEKARQEQEDLEKEEARRARKPRKSVSWAELPKLEKSSARSGDDSWAGGGARSSGKLPMRSNVVERFPTRSGASSPPLPAPMGDSDDETDPPSPASSDSHASERDHSNSVAFPVPDHSPSGSEDEDEPAENHGSEDGFDMDAMQHQREIALAYFEKRNTIGADAARAMSTHSHDLAGESEWEQEASIAAVLLFFLALELTESPSRMSLLRRCLQDLGQSLLSPNSGPSDLHKRTERDYLPRHHPLLSERL
jgi:hypothetical protein